MKTVRLFISLLLVLCIFVSDLGIAAFAESVLALPVSMEIIDEEAFYGAKSLDKVVLPDHLKEIRARAFASSSVKTINLPSSLTFIADDAFDETPLTRVTAVEGTYAYNWAVDHHYIIPKVPITIQSIRANVTTVETGTPITWTVLAEGGVAPLSYNYAVFKNGLYQDGFSVSKTEESVFAFTPTTGGYWSVLVTISDSLDTVASEISESVYAVDIASYGDIQLTLTTNLNTYLVGDAIQITAEKENAYGTVQYSFSAKDASDNVFASQNASSSSSFGFTASEAGDFTINGTVTDELGRSVSTQRTIHIYTEDEIKPAVPQSIQINGDTLPTDADQSVLYPQHNYKLSWDKVNNAESYHIQVIKTEGDTVTTLTDLDGYTETTYTISADSFASIEQETLVQIKVSAQTRATGDPAIGYFKVKTSDQQHTILVDGQFSTIWNEVFYDTTIRDFMVSSDVDWTFSPDHDWITCYRDGDRLTVVLTENPYKTQVLNGTVTISNGSQSAQIVITHGYLEEAPQLLTPSLSQTELSSTNQPYGNIYLKFDEKGADYVTAKIYKKNGSEYTYIAEESTNKSTMCLSVPSSIHAGDICMLELIGYTEAGFQTKDRSAQRTTARYYFTFSNEQHFIQVDGQETSSYQIIDTVTVQIHASTVWSWQSDSDWLQITVSNDEFAPDCKAYIRATANQTGEKRIGHLTITSGTSTAQITVMQDSFVPYVSYPTGLSHSSNSPTTLPMNNLSFIWHMASYISIIRDSDGFVMLQSPSNPQTGDSIIDVNTESFEKADWKANSTYTITLSNDYFTSYYYFKIGTSNSYYINLSDSEKSEVNILDWTVSAEAQTKTVIMKASGAWAITTDSDWLSVSATSGSKTTAGKSITVTIQQNTTGVGRNGNIIFKRGTYAEAVLHIEQAANNYLIVMNNDTLVPYTNNDTIYHISGKNDDFSLKVKTGCSWSVSSDSSWLAFDRSGSTTKNVTSTNTTLKIYCEENTIGNQTRVAKLTFSAGSESFVLFISQDACIDVPVVSTTITSTNINNPSVILYQDINFTWSPVAGAAKYVVKVMTSASDYTQQYYVEEDGSSEYSFTIPYSWLTVDGKAYFFRVNSIDLQGYEYTAPRYCYTVVYDEKATINGSTQPSWNNASDYQARQEFIVMSTSSWTAVSQQSWIHVSPANGESGDILTVTLDDNQGKIRNGAVEINVNDNITTLMISQCAKLSEKPIIMSPDYSLYYDEPTIVSGPISSITISWEVEPQADAYCIRLYNVSHHKLIAESEKIDCDNAGSYTFNDLNLTNDNIYEIYLVRYCYHRNTSVADRYFMPTSDQSNVNISSTSSFYPGEARLLGEADHERFVINSNGTWIATTDSDWIMVYRNSLDQEDLDENGRTPSYYDRMVGNPGTALYISALANHTGEPRYGNVTVTCGSASLTIPVSQDMYILPAQLTSPSLGSSSSEITSVPYADLKLRWSRGEGGNCTYTLTLKGKAHGERGYDTILEKDLGSKLSYTINRSYLEEGYDYLLRLTTEVDGLSSDWETYYFHVKYENELTVRIQITSNQIMLGSTVAVSASATGGAGQYRYSYELLRNNSTMNQTDLGAGDSYSFNIVNAGTYQIKVTVVDGSDETAYAFTPVFVVGDEETGVVRGQVTTASGKPVEGVSVRINNVNTGGVEIETVYTNQNGEWQWSNAIIGQSYTFIFSKTGFSFIQGSSLMNTVLYSDNDLGIVIASSDIDPEAIISGSILFQDGSGISGITIMLHDENGCLLHSTETDEIGEWRFYVEALGERYTVKIDQSVVTTTPAAHECIPYLDVNGRYVYNSFSAFVNNNYSNENVTFIMSETSVTIGYNVEFSITAKDSDSIRLLVDDKEIGVYPLAGSSMSLNYQFNVAGVHSIRFEAAKNGIWNKISDVKQIIVLSKGNLNQPVFADIGNIILGNDIELVWEHDERADQYDILVYRIDDMNDKILINQQTVLTGNSIKLDSTLFEDTGNYSVKVMAISSTYNQNEYENFFIVSHGIETVSIEKVCVGDGFASQVYVEPFELYALSTSKMDYIQVTQNGTIVSTLTIVSEAPGSDGFYRYTGTMVSSIQSGWTKIQFDGMKNDMIVTEKPRYFSFCIASPLTLIQYPVENDTVLRKYSNSKDIRRKLYISDVLNVLGEYENQYYVECNGDYGWVYKEEVFKYSVEQRASIVIEPVESYFIKDFPSGENASPPINIQWNVSNIPFGCELRAGVYEIGNYTEPTTRISINQNGIAEYTANNLSSGTYQGIIRVVSKEGKILTQNVDVLINVYQLSEFDKAFTKSAAVTSNVLIKESAHAMYNAYSDPNEQLTNLGFYTYKRSSGNITDIQRHSVGYYFARKDIIDESGNIVPLFAIIIRGSYGGFSSAEWRSNFVVGTDTEHFGFKSAALDVWCAFQQYLSNSWGISEAQDKYKVWITGHSRGAAVGNLLAGHYIHRPGSDVYAYLFATPRCTKSPTQNANIRNYIFEGDPVPRVPLKTWGFGRYGNDYYFPNGGMINGKKMLTLTQMNTVENALEGLITDSSKAEEIISNIYSFTDDANELITYLSQKVSNATAPIKQSINELIALINENAVQTDSSNENSPPKDSVFSIIFNAHLQENYMYWVDTHY